MTIIDFTRQPFRAVEHFAVPQTREGIAISPPSNPIAVNSMNGSNQAKDSPFRAESGRVLIYTLQDWKAVKVGEAATGLNAQGVSFTPDARCRLIT